MTWTSRVLANLLNEAHTKKNYLSVAGIHARMTISCVLFAQQRISPTYHFGRADDSFIGNPLIAPVGPHASLAPS